jgi:ABC-type protease/lipase transport system fused ATPase/permease subunit
LNIRRGQIQCLVLCFSQSQWNSSVSGGTKLATLDRSQDNAKALKKRSSAIVSLSKVVRMGVQVAVLAAGATLAVAGQILPGIMMAAMIRMRLALQSVEAAVAN